MTRVVLVGPPADRAKLRARFGAGQIEVVEEVETLAEARRVAASVDAWLGASPRDDDRAGPVLAEPLTVREQQVLEHLAEGLSNRAIGDLLGISDQTVKFHVATITSKLGAANRTESVRVALRLGLIEL